uniref:Uncharacterized protein n=1 Tax=Strigamia maritima TaxID=126957 RepID=T1IPW7_STRMM
MDHLISILLQRRGGLKEGKNLALDNSHDVLKVSKQEEEVSKHLQGSGDTWCQPEATGSKHKLETGVGLQKGDGLRGKQGSSGTDDAGKKGRKTGEGWEKGGGYITLPGGSK